MKKKTDLHWDSSQPPSQNARRVLPPLAREYFQLGGKVSRPDATEEVLHQFRLATKRFRYTLEMFLPVYGPGLAARLKLVRQVQQVLGEVQDCQTVRNMEQTKPHAQLVAWVEERMDQKKAEFQKLWREQFSTEQTQQRWMQYLDRYTRAPK